MFRLISLLLLITFLLIPSNLPAIAQTAPQAQAWPSEWQADSALYNLWSRADAPVAMGAARRSWLWGPVPFAVANETYAESPTGLRLVAYLDKARMEINDPSVDRASQWFVTSGLLVHEMVTGLIQTGNSTLDITHKPAELPVAGDPNSSDAPTYATFTRYTAPMSETTGKLVSTLIGRDGTLSPFTGSTDPKLFSAASYDAISGHNVPAVLNDWMRQQGPVLEGGRIVQSQALDPLYVLGRPITEAYWANVLVAGKPTTVLMQLFERRALTYNPNNPPEWRVEMANVGRAYYDWRYKGAPVDPAIAGEVTPDGVAAKGWNFTPAEPTRVEIDLVGGLSPLAGPIEVTPDSAGRFALTIPYNPSLQGALQSRANIIIRITSAKPSPALPLFGNPFSVGKVQFDGVLTQVERAATAYNLSLHSLDGKQWKLVLPASATVVYSEGSAAQASIADAGMAVHVEGASSSGVVTVSALKLLSTSHTGAQVAYNWGGDGASLWVGGTGWPGEHTVAFALASAPGAPAAPFATLKSDSRGDLTDVIKLPKLDPNTSSSMWLIASSSDKNTLTAQVAIPFSMLGSKNAPPPPQLYITSQVGAQMGGIGSYCWGGKCASVVGAPLPTDTLTVKGGDVLAFRSQLGTDPDSGLTPQIFSANLYAYPDSAGGQGALVNGTFYFTPKSAPLQSTGDLPGRPFSVALPKVMPSGKYAVVVNVSWPDPVSGKGSAVYGFALQAP